jgi:hypothetical protein
MDLERALEQAMDEQSVEILRICTMLKEGKHHWQKVKDMSCTYESQINENLYCILQCCYDEDIKSAEYCLKLNGQVIEVPKDLLEYLCKSVKQEIALRKAQEVTDILRTIR